MTATPKRFCFSSASWLQKEQTLTFLDQLTLCCVNVLYVLWDIWQHPWPGGEWGQNHPQLGITGTLCLSIYLLYSHTIFIPISYLHHVSCRYQKMHIHTYMYMYKIIYMYIYIYLRLYIFTNYNTTYI